MEPLTPYDTGTTIAGMALGAYTGSFIGAGYTNSLMIASGAIVGGYGGYKLGRLYAQGDKKAHADATKRVLNSSRDGEFAEWKSEETGHTGFVRTTSSYRGTSGEICRMFRAGAALDREVISGSGIACQFTQPGGQGSWRIVHDDIG